MDEDDIFPVLCPKKTYSNPSKKVQRATSESINMEKTSRRVGNVYDPGVPLTTKVAVEYLLSGKLKTNVCRYCLKVTVGLSELDQIMQIAGTGSMYKVSIREMIACFYPFKARQEESFPEKICQRCIDRAINAYLFTQQCEQAERALHNCFEDMNEKFNKLDPIDRKKKRGRQKLNPNTNTLYAEHHKVMDYAEPIRNIINLQSESFTNEPTWNEFECKKCWQVLPNLETLLNHEQLHPKYMWYHCRMCGKSFVKLNQLKRHFNQVHIRKKGVTEEVDKTFKCKECGNVTESYVQHLQHVEKHKFKSVMKHLIEKKTDQLCLVCLKTGTNLVELEKMVSIHGSCPELVGDTSLYTVLASTLPDQKSYKYQELHVPRKANIMTITKRKTKSEETQNISEVHFKLSLPKIVTKDKFKTDDFYYYVFCEPQTEFNEYNVDHQDPKVPRVVEIDEEDTINLELGDKMPADTKCTPVNKNTTEFKIPVDIKKLPTAPVNDNTVSEMVIEDAQELDLCKNIVINSTNHKEFLETTKNESNDIDSVDLIATNVEDSTINGGLCVPEKDFKNVTTANITFTDNLITDNLTSIEEKCPPVFRKQINLLNENKFDMKPKFIFSKPITLELNDEPNDNMISILTFSNLENNGIRSNKEIKEGYNPKYDIGQIKAPTDLTWIFTKAADSKNLLENNPVTENVTNGKSKPEIKGDDCKFCWLFKNVDKCEYCKKPIDSVVKNSEKIQQATEKNTNLVYKIIENTEKRVDTANFFDENNVIQPKPIITEMYAKERKIEKKWQCYVCLTENNKDITTCHCCESKKYIENDNCKITFGNNKTFIYKSPENEHKQEKEIGIPIQEAKPFAVIDEVSIMDTKNGTTQDNFEIQIESKETNLTYNMDTEADSFNYSSEIISEEMDIEEESFIPNSVQEFKPIPILVPNIVPFVGTNIQFNVGTKPIQNEKGARKYKRAVRNIPKAFHK